MKLTKFNYYLPKKLIAQEPVRPRDRSRLLVINRSTKEINHHYFFELPQFLHKGDCLVINQSKVIPARLQATKNTGGKVEVFLLKELKPGLWQALTKPGLRLNQVVNFANFLGKIKKLNANGLREIKFNISDKVKILSAGQIPLPPYIKPMSQPTKSRIDRKYERWYQTVYAHDEGSVAAPTAGLHFTNRLIYKLKNRGVKIVPITLHVGLGTFQPVKEAQIENHIMDEETFTLSKESADQLNMAFNSNSRIISVGTTSTRVLESCIQNKRLVAQSGTTKLFIYPAYKFKTTHGLITNFHLPKSTLLMLVSAFSSSPNTKEKFIDFEKSLIARAYQQAITKKYRFYSFGDAMLII